MVTFQIIEIWPITSFLLGGQKYSFEAGLNLYVRNDKTIISTFLLTECIENINSQSTNNLWQNVINVKTFVQFENNLIRISLA